MSDKIKRFSVKVSSALIAVGAMGVASWGLVGLTINYWVY